MIRESTSFLSTFKEDLAKCLRWERNINFELGGDIEANDIFILDFIIYKGGREYEV